MSISPSLDTSTTGTASRVFSICAILFTYTLRRHTPRKPLILRVLDDGTRYFPVFYPVLRRRSANLSAIYDSILLNSCTGVTINMIAWNIEDGQGKCSILSC